MFMEVWFFLIIFINRWIMKKKQMMVDDSSSIKMILLWLLKRNNFNSRLTNILLMFWRSWLVGYMIGFYVWEDILYNWVSISWE
jgi:hypothetical protein